MKKPKHHSAKQGFTLIEMGIVIAIVGLLAALGLMAFNNLQNTTKMKNLSGDLAGMLSHARSRAINRQRTQVIVIDAVIGTNKSYGYYHYEDNATNPNITAASNLSDIIASITASNPATAPAPYVLRLVDSNFQANQLASQVDPFFRGDAGTPLPFPFGAASPNTSTGCSFCNGVGQGAVAFLPTGRAIFNVPGGTLPDPNIAGGLVEFKSVNSTGNVIGISGVAISPTGFIQKLVQ